MVPFNRKTVFGEPKTRIYTAYGRITATPRSNSNLDWNEVKFCVERSENFDGFEYGYSDWQTLTQNMYYANEEAYNEMFRYSKATIMKDVETEEFTIVSLEYMDSENIFVTSADLYEQYSYSNDEITFYESFDSSKTKTYDLADNFRVYVNGVYVSDYYDNGIAYIEHNDSGKVTLIDATEAGTTTTDGKIDYILVDYYVDAIVDSVVDGTEYKIYFQNGHSDVRTMQIDTEDEDIHVRYFLDGEEISHTDLQSGDVVSIAYDITGSFGDSCFYDVIVSRDVVKGKVTETREDNNERPYYVINGQKYQPSKLGPVAHDILTPGNNYILWLNAFGKFVHYDEDTANKNIGIFDKASIDSSDTPKIRIITSAGTKVSYPVKDSSKTKYQEIASQFYTGVVGSSTLKPIEQLLCEYTINSNGYITSATPLTNVQSGAGKQEWKETTSKLGKYALSESTIIIDLSSKSNNLTSSDYYIEKVNRIGISDMIAGNEYEVICAEKAISDGTYRYVVLLSGETGYVEPEDELTSYIGIFDKSYIDSNDIPRIRFITKDGEKVSYAAKNNSRTVYYEIASNFYTEAVASSAHKPIEQLLCEYTINSNGYITSATPLDSVEYVAATPQEWKETTSKLGKYTLSESTIIIDLSSKSNNLTSSDYYVEKVSRIGISDLIAGNEYEVICAEKANSDGTYRYVVLLSGETSYIEPEDEIIGSYAGIFDKASIDSDDIPRIRIITVDGEKVSYPVEYISLYTEMVSQFYPGSVGSSVLKPIEELVCTYEISSKGYIKSITPMDGVGMITAEYDPEIKAFGSFELAEDAVILDLSSKNNWVDAGWGYEISVIQKKDFDDLVGYATYDVIVADENEAGKYGFAVLLTGAPAYTADTPIAVYDTKGSAYDDIQGTAVDTLEVYINGNDEKVALKVAPGTSISLNRGDVFVYQTDSNGYVDSIFKLFGSANESSYSWFMDNMTPANMAYKTVTSLDSSYTKSIPVLSSMPDEWIKADASTKTGEVDFVYGVITDKRNSNISISTIEESNYENNWGEVVSGATVNIDKSYDYTISPDANVYVYDYSERKPANRVYVGNPSSIIKSQVPSFEYIYLDNGCEAFSVMEDEYTYRELNFIFAKLVDGDIAECLVILGSY